MPGTKAYFVAQGKEEKNKASAWRPSDALGTNNEIFSLYLRSKALKTGQKSACGPEHDTKEQFILLYKVAYRFNVP